MEQISKLFVSVLFVTGLVMSMVFMIDLFDTMYQVGTGNAEFRNQPLSGFGF